MTQKEFVELCADGSYKSIIQALLSGIDPNEPAMIDGIPARAMFVAASSENFKAINALMEFKANTGDGFVAAVLCDKMNVAQYLHDLGADIDALDIGGTTALITAATMNRYDLVDKILGLGADPNVLSSAGHNALTYWAMMAACRHQEGNYINGEDYDIPMMLTEAGSDYREAIMISIKIGLVDLFASILAGGVDNNVRDSEGRSLVMLSVMSGGGLLEDMLFFGADPDLPDNLGRTPLMIAAINEETDPQVISWLLEYGADINARDNRGITPLMWSVIGVDRTPGELLPALIRTGGVRAEGWEKWLAFISLYSATKRELQLEMIRRLVREGADVNAVDKRGLNAMMYALLDGDNEIADILAEAGAKINFNISREE